MTTKAKTNEQPCPERSRRIDAEAVERLSKLECPCYNAETDTHYRLDDCPDCQGTGEIQPSGFCECGCGGKTTISKWNNKQRGWVAGQPRRFISNHHSFGNQHHAIPIETRFWSKVKKGEQPEDCWEWIGTKDRKGYGAIFYEGRHQRAHRISFLLVGKDLSPSTQLDHLCRNTSCVNPDHLEPVTNQENQLRGIAGQRNKERASSIALCPKGHPYTEENTYYDKKGWRACRTCHRNRERERMKKQPND